MRPLRIVPLALIGLPVLLGRPADAAAPGNDLGAALQRADGQFLRGDFKNACKEYLRISGLAQGKSAPALIGLSHCYTQLRQEEKAVAMARQARAAAATPEERTEALETLGEALLRQPDAPAKSESATVFQEELAGSKETDRGRAGLLAALLALHRDADATALLQSMRAGRMGEGTVHSFLCEAADLLQRTGSYPVDALNDQLRALDPDAPFQAGGKVTPPKFIRGYQPFIRSSIPGTAAAVTVASVVNPKGSLQDFRVTRYSPLGPEVVDSLTTLVFTPASLNGAPVPVCYMTTIKIDHQ